MSEPLNSSVLQRMLRAPANQLDQSEMSPAKALQIALARGAEGLAGLTAAVSEFREERLSLDDIVQSLEEPHLVHKLEEPGGAFGLAIWNFSAVSALTEYLITGRIAANTPETRKPTQTDASVVSDLLNRILELFDQELINISDVPEVCGFRPSTIFDGARAVSMAFDEMDYRMYRVNLDLENGARTGELRLIFPWDKPTPRENAPSGGSAWKTNWHHNVKSSNVMVEAILIRLPLPLDQIENLEVGSDIPIPLESIAKVSVEGADGKGVALGRLGQCNGFRAVRIANGSTAPDPQACNFSAANPQADVQELPKADASAPVPINQEDQLDAASQNAVEAPENTSETID